MVCCNPAKSASIRKSVFQIGLRFENGICIIEIGFEGFDAIGGEGVSTENGGLSGTKGFFISWEDVPNFLVSRARQDCIGDLVINFSWIAFKKFGIVNAITSMHFSTQMKME
jgi:hypothetical protein